MNYNFLINNKNILIFSISVGSITQDGKGAGGV